MKRYIQTAVILLLVNISVFAQLPKSIDEMTKEDVMALSYDELLELPFEDVLKLADLVGVSLDELYEMLLNKDVVSASKKAESSFEAPLSTSVISYDEIKASGARSVEEALRLVPGLIVREKTNGNFDVHIRGNDNLPANHMSIYSENSLTLVMIDSRPVYNYVNGGTFWESLPIGFEDIERIEVVRGPSSALYGPNAVSGVVNIITKIPESSKLSVSADIQGGSQSTLISSLGVGKRFGDKFSARVTGNFETMDRNQDLLYIYKLDDWITRDVYGTIDDPTTPTANDTNVYKLFDPSDGVENMYPDPSLARRTLGANGYLFYDHSDNLNASLKFGGQFSEILSSTVGDNPTSYAGRVSTTEYYDLNISLKGLHLQTNQMFGTQDVVRQDSGFKVDLQIMNTNLEYDLNFKGLNIRPGFFIQKASYDDTPNLRDPSQGFLQGERSIRSIAGSLRLDYTLFKSLRLIGAGRLEGYDINDKLYLSYQFIASYNLNNTHYFRVVASRANRGPFLVDTYAAYEWDRSQRSAPKLISFQGTKDQDLCTMDMIELGYRVKPIKSIQADFEYFRTYTRDFGALYPDSVNLNNGIYVRMTFDNIELESLQKGLSGTISWVANKDLIIKAFLTWQKTELTNLITTRHDTTTYGMIVDANINAGILGQPYSTNFNAEKADQENTATPQFYGGLIINYSPIDKLNLNVSGYYYSKQVFSNKYGDYTIDPKFIINAKIGYEMVNGLQAYINLRNGLGKQVEFGYMDEIGTLFLFGLTYNLN